MDNPSRCNETENVGDISTLLSAQRLNTFCFCPQEGNQETPSPQIATVPVFLSSCDYEKMRQIIATIESVVASPAWQQRILADAPEIAKGQPGNAGVLYGYDFHLSETGPQLIEINTNAGGALIVSEVLRAQSGCCSEPGVMPPATEAFAAESAIIDSLLNDFEQVRGHKQPRLIAIVDVNPAEQYLFPEFQRFVQLLHARGLKAEIADPGQLVFADGALYLRGQPVDLVYNRLTDFYLADPTSEALRRAYLSNGVVVTPNPRHHALYADKRNLALLSDAAMLSQLGVNSEQQKILLDGIPATRRVDKTHADTLWSQRKLFFFKPATAYGGKGAYRGAKLTRGTFEQLLEQDYIAQREVEPTLRRAIVNGEETELKVDVRCYVYQGEIQLTAARLWRGQTTNFRTPGGGFATITRTVC